MEKVFFKNDNITICGVLHKAKNPKAIIIMSHGFTGSKDETHNLFVKTGDKLSENGYSALRFDHTGTGESGGEQQEATLTMRYKDVNSAIEFVKSLGYKKIILLGFSLGGSSILNANEDSIIGKTFWSPIADKMPRWEKHHQEIIKSNSNCLIREGRKIPIEFFEDFENQNFSELNKKTICPTLIIYGTKDRLVSNEHSKLLHNSIKNSELIGIKGAGHSFHEPYEKEVINKTLDWLRSISI